VFKATMSEIDKSQSKKKIQNLVKPTLLIKEPSIFIGMPKLGPLRCEKSFPRGKKSFFL